MPFTLAHPAIALPLRRVWRPGFLALVLGTMSPDLPYFVPSPSGGALPEAHSLAGALTYGPLYGLTLLVCAAVLRPVLIAPLWGAHRAVVDGLLAPYGRSLTAWLHAAPALVLGCLLHLLCDSATHRGGWLVGLIPVLTMDIPLLGDRHIPLYHVLQYAGSLVGLGLMLWWYQQELRAAVTTAHPSPRPVTRRALLLSLLTVSVVLGVRAAWRAPPAWTSPHGELSLALTVGVASFVVFYLVHGCTLICIERRRQATVPRAAREDRQ